jgi:hypothetical protein
MDKYILTDEENENLQKFIAIAEQKEMAEVNELISTCNDPEKYAKAHSNFVVNWEKRKQEMEDDLKNRILPPNTSFRYNRAVVDELDLLIKKKLKTAQKSFYIKFGESIFNYLGKNGKINPFSIFKKFKF